MVNEVLYAGGSLPLVLCEYVGTKGIFMGAIYLLVWVLGNPLTRKKIHQIFNTLKVIRKYNIYYFK